MHVSRRTVSSSSRSGPPGVTGMARKKSKAADEPENGILSLAPRILELLDGVQQLELENFSMEIGDLDLFIPAHAAVPAAGSVSVPHTRKPVELIREEYNPRTTTFPGRIREVT